LKTIGPHPSSYWSQGDIILHVDGGLPEACIPKYNRLLIRKSFISYGEGLMLHPLVMTIIGRDRTGLVESLSRTIADKGGSWLESRMCRLGGEFAGILRIQVPADREQRLVESLKSLQAEGLAITIRPDETVIASGTTRGASLSLIGQDRPGIIYQISSALASRKINVEVLESECFSAPMSGEMMFSAVARLRIPESCAISDIRRKLEEIGSELMVDISFTED
jgi:glycine cleavage system regulatory protein